MHNSRWADPEASRLQTEVWRRLAAGQAVDDLRLGQNAGRVDLRGIGAAPPVIEKQTTHKGRGVQTLGRLIEVAGATWTRLDLSGASLRSLRFDDVTFVDCVFNSANCSDWRLWRCRVIDCSFRRANLRDAAMAGWHHRFPDRYANTWRRVDFQSTDLRGSGHFNELYEDCDFQNAKLDGVDFSGARHHGSRFAGPVRDVVFSKWPDTEPKPSHPNEMTAVDLSGAVLYDVEFRDLALLDVRLPVDSRHVIYRPRYAVALELRESLRRFGPDEFVDLRVLVDLDLTRGPRGDAYGIVNVASLGAEDEERRQAAELLRAAHSRVVAGNGTAGSDGQR